MEPSTVRDNKSEIQAFFSGKKIFITGVTGFLGSVLLEKLLRSCDDVDTVYVLARAKKGLAADARIRKMFDSELFCRIRPMTTEKVVAVEGDVSRPRLGLSPEAEEMLAKSVHVVFHVAASTNFGANLRQAVATNYQGTKRVVELSRKMTNLQVFLHVSTAYCNGIIRGKIREEVYPSWIDGDEVVEILRAMDDAGVEKSTKDLLGGQPNTYAFTKHLSENLLYKTRTSVPIAVVRPSVVLGTWKEPVPGWVENVQNGGVAFMAGAGKGVFRTVMADPTKVSDIVPCDMVANLSIAAAWEVAAIGKGTFRVYHCTSGLDNPLLWDSYCNLTIEKVIEHPCRELFWYPSAKCRMSLLRNFLFIALYHLLPAFVLYVMERCNGRNRPIFSYQRKFIRGMSFVRFFTKRNWHFETRNTQRLCCSMSQADCETFDFDVTKIDWPSYMESCVLGVRRYYHGESPKTVGKARKTVMMLRLAHYAAYAAIFATAYYLLSLNGFQGLFLLWGALAIVAFFIWL